MFAAPPADDAEVFARLPETHRREGAPSPRLETHLRGTSRPALLEGPCFDHDGTLCVVDVAFGRIFTVSPQREFASSPRMMPSRKILPFPPKQEVSKPMQKIAKVEARTISVPLDRPTAFSNRRVTKRDYAVVRVTGEDGVSGIGFCYGGHNAGALVTMAVRTLFAPLLLGEDAHRVPGLWQEMYQEALLHGRAGAVMRALSVLDIAMWDRNARAAGLPLHRFLGGVARETVPAYASGGYYLDGKTANVLGKEMASYVSMGFKAVKMKVGQPDPAFEEARIAAAREAIGPDVHLMLDANNAWSDLETALRFMRIYEPYDPFWIEEPFSPDDIDNHRRLAERIPVPVATGEIEVGRWRHLDLLRSEAAIILQTDAAVCGGITEWRRIAATAASFGVTLYPHWFHDLHVHLVAAEPNARYVEFFPDDQVLNFRRLVDRQLETKDGQIVLPTGPGLGFDFDADALEQYAADDWA